MWGGGVAHAGLVAVGSLVSLAARSVQVPAGAGTNSRGACSSLGRSLAPALIMQGPGSTGVWSLSQLGPVQSEGLGAPDFPLLPALLLRSQNSLTGMASSSCSGRCVYMRAKWIKIEKQP